MAKMLEGDCISIMMELARWAGIPEGGFRRMVLVLDIDNMPQLFTEGLVRSEKGDNLHLPPANVQVHEQAVAVPPATCGLEVVPVDRVMQEQMLKKWRQHLASQAAKEENEGQAMLDFFKR